MIQELCYRFIDLLHIIFLVIRIKQEGSTTNTKCRHPIAVRECRKSGLSVNLSKNIAPKLGKLEPPTHCGVYCGYIFFVTFPINLALNQDQEDFPLQVLQIDMLTVRVR